MIAISPPINRTAAVIVAIFKLAFLTPGVQYSYLRIIYSFPPTGPVNKPGGFSMEPSTPSILYDVTIVMLINLCIIIHASLYTYTPACQAL